MCNAVLEHKSFVCYEIQILGEICDVSRKCTKRVRETRHVCTLLVGTHEGKAAIGRDSSKKQDNIKVNLFRLQG